MSHNKLHFLKCRERRMERNSLDYLKYLIVIENNQIGLFLKNQITNSLSLGNLLQFLLSILVICSNLTIKNHGTIKFSLWSIYKTNISHFLTENNKYKILQKVRFYQGNYVQVQTFFSVNDSTVEKLAPNLLQTF